MSSSYNLRNNLQIPLVGFGTGGIPVVQTPDSLTSQKRVPGSLSRPKDVPTKFIFDEAIEAGYRLFDTSAAYKNEEIIKQSIEVPNFFPLLPITSLCRFSTFRLFAFDAHRSLTYF